MDKKLLPRNFFRDNPLDKMSAPLIAHFSMTAGFDEKLQNGIFWRERSSPSARHGSRRKKQRSPGLKRVTQSSNLFEMTMTSPTVKRFVKRF